MSNEISKEQFWDSLQNWHPDMTLQEKYDFIMRNIPQETKDLLEQVREIEKQLERLRRLEIDKDFDDMLYSGHFDELE